MPGIALGANIIESKFMAADVALRELIAGTYLGYGVDTTGASVFGDGAVLDESTYSKPALTQTDGLNNYIGGLTWPMPADDGAMIELAFDSLGLSQYTSSSTDRGTMLHGVGVLAADGSGYVVGSHYPSPGYDPVFAYATFNAALSPTGPTAIGSPDHGKYSPNAADVYRLVRDGLSIKVYYSVNGISWWLLRSWVEPIPGYTKFGLLAYHSGGPFALVLRSIRRV